MNGADVGFLEDLFKRYYFDHPDLIRVPERAPEREFGYQRFGSGMVRHVSVRDDRELRLLLMQNVPSDVYCSNAYYTFPNLPMNEKDWKEADLIFDIDAKDLNLPCRPDHTVLICGDCGEISRGPGKCTKCGSAKTDKKSLPCRDCMDASKREAEKLSSMLTGDLGIPKGDIHVYFSGNEGFHLYAYGSQFQGIGSRERLKLADYLMFNGAIPERFGMRGSRPSRSDFPELGEEGWRGRFAAHVFGSKSRRSKIVSGLIDGGRAQFQTLLDGMSKTAGARIDPGVTMDIHRIFRMPGSLNGKSGLAKVRCGDLAGFDPYADAVLLGGDTVEVVASSPVRFRLRGRGFGPYSGERVTVPAYAAAYMICKKLATIA